MKQQHAGLIALALCLAVAFAPLPELPPRSVITGGFKADMKTAADGLWPDVVDAAETIGDGLSNGSVTSQNLKENVDKAKATIGERLAKRMQEAFSKHVQNAPPDMTDAQKADWDKQFTPKLATLLKSLK